MKKIVSVLCAALFILFISACSQDNAQPSSEEDLPQILFHDLKWGSSHESVMASISDGECSMAGDAYMAYPDSPFDYAPLAANAGNMLAVSSLDVLGHDAVSALFFSYSLTDSKDIDKSKDRLYLIRSQILADDCEEAYKDICDGLTALYGDGIEDNRTGQSLAIDSSGAAAFGREVLETLWAGADSSFARVKLDVPSAHDVPPTLFVAFGILDAADTLKIIEAG